ncbi:MAG: 3-keto-5-aminohexanoate cleavage protein [Actinomycetota bacterium]
MSVFITCAVTGSGDTAGKSEHVPVTPEEIATSAIDAAKAGAAVVHCHVRDPETGAPGRDPDLYREVVDRIRSSDTDVVINLTTGMGGDIVYGSVEAPAPLDPEGTDLAGATERIEHIRECKPEICTLDVGTMNFGEGNYIMANTTATLDEMARQIRDAGVRPELELFDTGHLWYAKDMDSRGLFEGPVLAQLCMGVPWGVPPDMNSLMAMVNNLPDDWVFSAFGIGAQQLRYVAAALLVGGNIRVGLEDNLYLERGVQATNAMLVERAAQIVGSMNESLMTPAEVREKLNLTKHG